MLQAGSTAPAPLGWGWADNGWGTPGANIFFETTGTHTLRFQQREDGVTVDQIVLSSDTFLLTARGPRRSDTTILPANDGSGGAGGSGGSAGTGDVLLHPSAATVIVGDWTVNADPTAATGASLLNLNRNAAKISTASVSPANYFEMTFDATAGVAYRLWLRGKATADPWANDSVFVQFSDSVDSAGLPKYQIGTTGATNFNLEKCSGCGLAGWGWEDNGWGTGVAGPLIYFATTGAHTMRVQVREDGLAIDQILLSPDKYKLQSPGLTKNDATILQ